MRLETPVKPEPGIHSARSKDGEKYDDDEVIEISDSDSESTLRSPEKNLISRASQSASTVRFSKSVHLQLGAISRSNYLLISY